VTATRAMAMVRAIITAKMLAGNKEGRGKGSKDDGNGDEGGRRQRGQ
jgi:hypothetical protein